jgi:NodT family efflux transporter outer membrane factor (OMF) lipoprotein
MKSYAHSPRVLPLAASLAVAGGLTGCMVGPDFQKPTAETPAAYTDVGPSGPNQRSVTTPDPIGDAQWWKSFNDPVLDQLIAEALENNFSLKEAESRIRQARAQRSVAASGLFPSVDLNSDYRRSFSSPLQRPSGVNTFRAGFDAAWELDIFGGTRRAIEAADADIEANIEDGRAVLVSLLAELASDYIDLREFQQRILTARQNLEVQVRSLDLTRRRFTGGFVSGLDVANAEAQVASTRAVIPVLEASARQTIYAIAVLIGKQPQVPLEQLSPEGPIPVTPPEVPVGLPSELLRRRPDIRRAEARIHAATARIGVATADLFPRFSVTGSLGLQSSQISDLTNWSSRFWSIGPSMSWPIFNAGRLASNIAVQRELQTQQFLDYQATVLVALRDVESALIAYSKEHEHYLALVDAVNANRRAVDLATQLYREGQTDFLNVLEAQRSLYQSEDQLTISRRTLASNLVALYKALGGGWQDAEEIIAARPEPFPQPQAEDVSAD